MGSDQDVKEAHECMKDLKDNRMNQRLNPANIKEYTVPWTKDGMQLINNNLVTFLKKTRKYRVNKSSKNIHQLIKINDGNATI